MPASPPDITDIHLLRARALGNSALLLGNLALGLAMLCAAALGGPWRVSLAASGGLALCCALALTIERASWRSRVFEAALAGLEAPRRHTPRSIAHAAPVGVFALFASTAILAERFTSPVLAGQLLLAGIVGTLVASLRWWDWSIAQGPDRMLDPEASGRGSRTAVRPQVELMAATWIAAGVVMATWSEATPWMWALLYVAAGLSAVGVVRMHGGLQGALALGSVDGAPHWGRLRLLLTGQERALEAALAVRLRPHRQHWDSGAGDLALRGGLALLRQEPDAERWFQASLRIEPRNAAPLLGIAMARLQQGRPGADTYLDEARRQLESPVHALLLPDLGAVLDGLDAWAATERKRPPPLGSLSTSGR